MVPVRLTAVMVVFLFALAGCLGATDGGDSANPTPPEAGPPGDQPAPPSNTESPTEPENEPSSDPPPADPSAQNETPDNNPETPGNENKTQFAEPFEPVWGNKDHAPLRPGSAAPGCTFNYLWIDPVVHAYFIGTAAHCTDNPDAVDVEDGTGIRYSSPAIGEIGTVVFDSDSPRLQEEFGVEDRVDFSLVILDEGINLQAHPSMLDFAGPFGIVGCGDVSVGDLLSWHGYAVAFGQTEFTQPRSAVMTQCDGKDYSVEGPMTFGDSGASVIHQSGDAIGIVSRAGIGSMPPAVGTGATIPYILDELAKVPYLGNVTMVTIPEGTE